MGLLHTEHWAEHLGVALGAVDLLLVLAGGEGLAHQAPAARLAPEAGGVEAAAPGLDVLALRGLAAPGAGVSHVGRVAVLAKHLVLQLVAGSLYPLLAD